jgi:hypothetical protein
VINSTRGLQTGACNQIPPIRAVTGGSCTGYNLGIMPTTSEAPVSGCILCKTRRRHMVCIRESRPPESAASAVWLVGEHRLCWLGVQPDANGKPTGRLDKLVCPASNERLEPHNMNVTFKGVIDPVDTFGKQQIVADQWLCTRDTDSFFCVPTATPAKP